MKDGIEAATPRRPDEVGVPDPFPYMHPVMKKNYGNWEYHDRPRPGVLRHVSKTGDLIFTVRAGTQRQMDVSTIRKLADIGDDFADGHVRFTTRSNIEFMVSDEAKVAPLMEKPDAEGFPVGGTGASVSMVSHTQGWLHCDIPGTDASGVVKGLMDLLHKEFSQEKMPNRGRVTTSCCQINCGGQGDIAVNVQYTKPPKINHDLVANVCERPAVVARCPPMQINGDDSTKIAIWVGGKHSNARSKPTFHKLAVANLPNNAPHWPEVVAVVKTIVEAYKKDAKHWERMGEWIERIGWNRFFDMTGLTFTKHHLDTWTGARKTMNSPAHVHF